MGGREGFFGGGRAAYWVALGGGCEEGLIAFSLDVPQLLVVENLFIEFVFLNAS